MQAVIALSIDASPATLRLDATDAEEPFEIGLCARIKWSARPAEPLTLSTWGTLFECFLPPEQTGGYVPIASSVFLRTVKDPIHSLPMNHPRPGCCYNIKEPMEDDWREAMEFLTLPAQESGERLRATCTLKRKWLSKDEKWSPRPGDEYRLSVDADCRVAWWNWGSLDGNLKGRRFTHCPSPRISPGSLKWLREGDVQSYGAWDEEDEEGNEMVFLECVAEAETPTILFV